MKYSIFFAAFFFLFMTSTNAFAELQVFPLRLTLSDKERSAQISLRHKGNKKESYRITAVFYKMGLDGSMKLVEKTAPEDKDGRGLFRFSPRQVTLEPNIEQVVRLVARIPANLEEGEYRCHLHFEAMSDNDSPVIQGKDANGATMVLKANMAVAVPVIIKRGNTQSKVSLNNFKILKDKANKYSFSVEMVKEGNGFAYGNIEVISTDDKSETQILTTINGISSYIDKRIISFPLSVSSLPKGKIKLLFKDSADAGDKVLASAETNFTP